jgi:hypothetical protein
MGHAGEEWSSFFDYCLSAEGFAVKFARNPYHEVRCPYDRANPT